MRQQFPASLASLAEMLAFVRLQAQAAGFKEMQLDKIELAAEEIFVNIISYGYPNSQGHIDVQCHNLPEQGGLQIIVSDQGLPFNPLIKVSNVAPSSKLDERPPGGYGIFFVLKIMDEVVYYREGEVNYLHLKKFFPS
jgi:anti-sigma regulatory factor (Ser/Thr protein kinase)